MKRVILSISVVAAMAFTSCIQDELMSPEADILDVHLSDESVLASPPIISNDEVMFIIPESKGRLLTPTFELTEGATISPASGVEHDFTQPVSYTVTAEDRKSVKKYTVRVLSELKLKYDFETYEEVTAGRKKYIKFYELVKNIQGDVIETQTIWASGNQGAAAGGVGDTQDKFPTSVVEGQGRNGSSAAKMTTTKVPLGAIMKAPIAAGNLFLGKFDLSDITKPLTATRFGFPINKKPIALKGWYQYTSGINDVKGNPTFKDNPDSCRIYAVLYESDENGLTLDGTNILTSDRVVAMANFQKPAQTTEWAPFSNEPGKDQIPFVYEGFPNVFQQDKLLANKYNITVVFSSSYRGDEFIGAIGSTLLIDDVEIITQN